MGTSFVLSGLKNKRARIAGEIAAAEQAIAKQRETLATLDAVIAMFSPVCVPDMIPPIRPYRRGLYFGYQELARLTYAALREASGPMTTGAIADYAIAAKGLDVDSRVRAAIREKCRAALVRLQARGKVRKIVDWPEAWWELAGQGHRDGGDSG